MKFKIKRKLVVTHLEHRTQAQRPYCAASNSLNSRAKNSAVFAQIRCTTPKTFSQKLYQSHALEELEESSQSDALVSLKNLLERCLKSEG